MLKIISTCEYSDYLNIELVYKRPKNQNPQKVVNMLRSITLILIFIITLIPLTQSTNAQVPDFADVQLCATDSCDVRLTQWKAGYISWELEVRCFINGQWKQEAYRGDGVYSGSLCNNAISYQGDATDQIQSSID